MCALSSADRVPGYEPVGRRFESCRARQKKKTRSSVSFSFCVTYCTGFESLCLCRYDRQKLSGGEFLGRCAALVSSLDTTSDRERRNVFRRNLYYLAYSAGRAKKKASHIVRGFFQRCVPLERDSHYVRDADFVCDARLRRVSRTHRITYHSAAASLITKLKTVEIYIVTLKHFSRSAFLYFDCFSIIPPPTTQSPS